MKARLQLFLGVLAVFALVLPAPALASIQLHSNSETATGGTGYQPVPPGHRPGGRAERIALGRAVKNSSRLSPVPSGRLPLGTGKLPVLPVGFTAVSTYDFENRLVTHQYGQIVMVYDGDGNRVKKTASGMSTYYVVDDRNPTGYAQVIEELTSVYSGATTLQRVYTHGHALISQDQLVNNQWVRSYYGHDGHGSVRYLADGQGSVTDAYDYDAFGVLIRATGSTPNSYLYCGEQYDAQLGFYYLRARYANPKTGRFWNMDSYEGNSDDPSSLHKYLYCHANPVNGTDPSGHDFISTLSAISVSAQIAAFNFMAVHGALAETMLFVTALGYVQTCRELNTGLDEDGNELTTFGAAMLYAGLISDLLPGGKAVRIGVGSVIRKVILRPSNPGWGLTKQHLRKHFFGNESTALKNIDPAGNADKWAQHLAELFNAPVTTTLNNGKIVDIVKEFPKASGNGTFKMGIRLSPNANGTYDLVTVLTDQSKF